MPKSRVASGTKFYAVAIGRTTGVFRSWDECKAQVHKFKSAKYKSFETEQGAIAFVNQYQKAKKPNNTEKKQAAAPSSSPRANPQSGTCSKPPSKPSKKKSSPSKKSPKKKNKTLADHILAESKTRPRRGRSSSSSMPVTEPDQVDKYTLLFDGGSRGNPGIAGAGYHLRNGNSELWSESYTLPGTATNNEAEYCALTRGLEKLARSKFVPPTVTVSGDSLLVINQMTGSWKINCPRMRKWNQQASSAVSILRSKKVKLHFRHIVRSKNKKADELANQAMDMHKFR
eukprot:TRINITY_DN5452_c0_g1_i2.p1 TRINITY_DN5452_c0_g1~~TRINITY_DN5452_c0_g1_i2.p1  ORF type:complete len:286 (+),score=31.17 TRINITY_DN5452_c0_g1_i2:40-897(+)